MQTGYGSCRLCAAVPCYSCYYAWDSDAASMEHMALEYMEGWDRKKTKKKGQSNPTSPGVGVRITFFSTELPLHQFGIRAVFVRDDINMPPRRCPYVTVEEAIERDHVLQLEQ
ncbi:hypothetical protein LWI28_010826 [Acer negundo]|uniref:Uncharacterized protein n=1 Tax=Acer negundo TaxID=4023 RepID=A0AAD5NXS4_ACENE|nr:hypothetical protein LWI28_010826 [Acer negundo]